MRGRVSLATLVALVVGIAAALAETPAGTSKSPMLAAEETWVVDLDSWGGIANQGGGAAHITSQGIVTASLVGHLSPRSCRAELSRSDFQKIAQAVASAKPSAWKSSYVPHGDEGCCDRFHWTLTLHQRAPDGSERAYKTDWYDGNLLPDNLTTLRAAILTIKSAVLKGCQPRR